MTAATCLVAALAGTAAAEQPEPSSSQPPMVVTRALLRELATGARAWHTVLDRETGVVYLDEFGSAASEEEPVAATPQGRLCGRQLDRRLRTVRAWLRDAAPRDADDGGLRCSNRGAAPTCWFGASMEYDPLVELRFRVDPARGVVLTAVTRADVVLVDPKVVAADERARTRTIARLARGTCATP